MCPGPHYLPELGFGLGIAVRPRVGVVPYERFPGAAGNLTGFGTGREPRAS